MATTLTTIDLSSPHTFIRPIIRIHDEQDVSRFLNSQAYAQIVAFLFQLNVAMFPQLLPDEEGDKSKPRRTQTWETGSTQVEYSVSVKKLALLLEKLDAIIDEVPLDKGPRRFGNVSFRKWYSIVEERMWDLLREHLPQDIVSLDKYQWDNDREEGEEEEPKVRAVDELSAYFIGSFGSAQRLDYGTGHELSFLAFLGGIWRLGGFGHGQSREAGVEERGIVLGVIESYLRLARRLIKTYTLEPAGSHGVWGLDDHFFLPYIFGSAQLCPAIAHVGVALPTEGSLSSNSSNVCSASPDCITNQARVERERHRNMYFGAVGFINDVKRGPFWEHSPVLYDISGVQAGWAKINRGMLRMYNAEVLSKFPVVQHFPFGSVFAWERHADAVLHQGNLSSEDDDHYHHALSADLPSIESGSASQVASIIHATPSFATAPPSRQQVSRGGGYEEMKAPWASGRQSKDQSRHVPLPPRDREGDDEEGYAVPTRAPWAK